MIIILDGSKGAGKSTTAKPLCDVLPNSVSLSIDNERALLGNHEGKTIQERIQSIFLYDDMEHILDRQIARNRNKKEHRRK